MTKKKVTKKRVSVKKKPTSKKNTNKKSKTPDVSSTIPLFIYRRIALTFVILVAAVLIVVIYLSTMQAVIKVTPVQTTLSSDFIVSVVDVPLSNTDVEGVFIMGGLEKTQNFIPSNTGAKEVDSISEGEVVIYNELSFDQELVKTTRFLSSDNVLFRLSEGVVVPAGGSVVGQVYADKEGVSGNSDPTDFTIPGLSEVRQKKVFAKSDKAFSGGVVSITVVSQIDLDKASALLQQKLIESSKDVLRKESSSEFTGEIFKVEIIDESFSIDPDTEADNFDVTLKLSVAGVFYDKDALNKVAIAKLYEGLGQGKELISEGIDSMEITIDKYDSESETTKLLVRINGQSITSQTSKALEVGRFSGKTKLEVEDMLVGEGVAKSVYVEFFPFWVRTVPRLKDHIYIETL